MKKVCLSLLLIIGVSVFASEGPGGGGADKYGNTNTGAESEDSDHGATSLSESAASGAMADGSADSAGENAGNQPNSASEVAVVSHPNERARSFLSRSTGANTLSRVVNDVLVSENIANFLTVPEAIHGLGLVNKTCHRIGNFRSRCAHAASVFKELMKELVLEGHIGHIECIAVMPDGRIVSGLKDGTIRVWNPAIAAGQPGHVVALEGHTRDVTCVAVLQDGRIVSGSRDRTIRVSPINGKEYDEEYFKRKVARTHDPREYEIYGAEIYKILFGFDDFSVWFKEFIKTPGEEEIANVLGCLIRMNFILDGTHALQFKKSPDAGSFAQAQLILTELKNIKSPTLGRRQVNALGESKYFNQWLKLLEKLIDRSIARSASVSSGLGSGGGGGSGAALDDDREAAAYAAELSGGSGNGGGSGGGGSKDQSRGETAVDSEAGLVAGGGADGISTPLTTETSDASVASSAEASVESSSSGAATVPAKRKAGDMTAVDREAL